MTLLYFDIFHYPLKTLEIFRFLRTPHRCLNEVAECLEELTAKRQVFRFGDLYSMHADEHNIQRRIKGNCEAAKWLTVAEKQARFIARFPFVRAVMASGSLSKGYMDESSDLDFFVVTSPNHLWVARTLLVLYKRLFLFNSHKHFCVNYFVDTNHMEIEEKNLFTATELATLIPLYNYEVYEVLIAANNWILDFFPNFIQRPERKADTHRTFIVRTALEVLLRPLTTWLDVLFMKLSRRRWNRLYARHYAKEDFELAFKTRRYVSKNHPNHYQKKILDLYKKKIVEFQDHLSTATMTYE